MSAPVAEPETATADLVLASVDARADTSASVERFLQELAGRGTLWVVEARGDRRAEQLERQFPHVRVLFRPAGTLVPELWREGLLASRAPRVAFSTTAMQPARGWLDALLEMQANKGVAGVGGPIEPAAGLCSFDRALYLQRYVSYHRPLRVDSRIDPPGDNALYEREALLGVEPSWREGLWEVAVHRALKGQGKRLAMAPAAAVAFQGGSSRRRTLAQRFAHARHYAGWRSAQWSTPKRLARLAATPCVPALLAARTARTMQARGLRLIEWTRALPELALLLAAWTAGEASGLALGPRRQVRASSTEPRPDLSDLLFRDQVALSSEASQR